MDRCRKVPDFFIKLLGKFWSCKYINKNNFRGDLSDMSAETATLTTGVWESFCVHAITGNACVVTAGHLNKGDPFSVVKQEAQQQSVQVADYLLWSNRLPSDQASHLVRRQCMATKFGQHVNINNIQVCLVKPDTFKPESIINRTFFGRRIRARRLKLRCCKPESAINWTLFGEPTCPV